MSYIYASFTARKSRARETYYLGCIDNCDYRSLALGSMMGLRISRIERIEGGSHGVIMAGSMGSEESEMLSLD